MGNLIRGLRRFLFFGDVEMDFFQIAIKILGIDNGIFLAHDVLNSFSMISRISSCV